MRQIAGGTKENQGVATKITHGKSPFVARLVVRDRAVKKAFEDTFDTHGFRFLKGKDNYKNKPVATSFLTCLPQSVQYLNLGWTARLSSSIILSALSHFTPKDSNGLGCRTTKSGEY